MATFKSSDWKEVKFNGQDVTKIILNGTTVWEKVTKVMHTKMVSFTSESKNQGIGKYPVKGTVYIDVNAFDIEVDAPNVSSLTYSYNETTGSLYLSGFTFKANMACAFAITYYTEE